MRTAISLLVMLFSMCGAQTRSTQTEVQAESQSTGAAAAEVSTQLDIYAEMKELRDMVVELKVTLRHTIEDVKVLEAENVAVKTEVNDLKRENAAQEAEMTAVKTRLAATESEVMNLKKVNEELETRLEITVTKVEGLKVENAAQEAEFTTVKTRLTSIETEVENLRKEIKTAPKVAFSAGLSNSEYIESGSTDMNLVFKNLITNVGQAYSSITGFFTAPVKGVYYFRFTVSDHLGSAGLRYMSIQMCKNGKQLMWLREYDLDHYFTYLSSGLTLQLEAGDVVNMVLPAKHRLFDMGRNDSTFNGFLLFPL